jgi:hypothetical protein
VQGLVEGSLAGSSIAHLVSATGTELKQERVTATSFEVLPTGSRRLDGPEKVSHRTADC